MRKLLVFCALVSMFLSITAVAHAEALFPFASGYYATYSASQGSTNPTTWNCEIQFVGKPESLPGGAISPSYWWEVMQQTNWNNDGQNPLTEVRLSNHAKFSADTPYTLYQYDAALTNPAAPSAPYSVPLLTLGQTDTAKVGANWPYVDAKGNSGTATIVSFGKVTVPVGTYSGVYGVHYFTQDSKSVTQQDEIMYWAPGVGLIEDVDSSPSLTSPITRKLTNHPVAELLIGTWNGAMTVVQPGSTAVETGTVVVTFTQVTNTTQAYTGTLTFTPTGGSAQPSLTFSAIRGPFDPYDPHPYRLRMTAQNNVIIGEMRSYGGQFILDLQGSAVDIGNTFASVGLEKQ